MPGAGRLSGPSRIRVVCTGVVRPKRRERGPRRYLPGGWGDAVAPVNAFAVHCREGICLFDTGQRASSAPLPGLHPFLRLARFELDPADEAAAQLEPSAVRQVVLSHLHTDHVAGVAGFPLAEIVVSRAEWSRATGLRGRLRGYVPGVWPHGVVPRLVDLDEPAPAPFAGALDVSGDGSLVLLGTPGHTPGHLSLLVRGPAWQVLLAGDLAHDHGELEREATDIAAWCRAEGVAVCTAHDPDAAAILAAVGAS